MNQQARISSSKNGISVKALQSTSKRLRRRAHLVDCLHSCLRYICDETGCNSNFRRPYDLIRHKKTIHGPKERCGYEQCTYATARSDKMNEHVRKKHTGIESPQNSELPDQYRNNARYPPARDNNTSAWQSVQNFLEDSPDAWLQLWTEWSLENGYKDWWIQNLNGPLHLPPLSSPGVYEDCDFGLLTCRPLTPQTSTFY